MLLRDDEIVEWLLVLHSRREEYDLLERGDKSSECVDPFIFEHSRAT